MNVFFEPRPKARAQGSKIYNYVVEAAGNKDLHKKSVRGTTDVNPATTYCTPAPRGEVRCQ